jgi:hypothetical protein
MLKADKICPRCQKKLAIIDLSELITEKGKLPHAAPSVTSVIFNYFDLFVCGECGYTAIYAGPEARKVAAEKRDAIIGIS